MQNVFEKYESIVRSYCRTFPKEFVKSKNSIIYDVDGNEIDMKAATKYQEREERRLAEDFSNQIQGSVSENTKLFGYIKRYVLIGIVTGIPGIAITYLFDKWEENKMVKDLYIS